VDREGVARRGTDEDEAAAGGAAAQALPAPAAAQPCSPRSITFGERRPDSRRVRRSSL
jgi:hypothetical protein